MTEVLNTGPFSVIFQICLPNTNFAPSSSAYSRSLELAVLRLLPGDETPSAEPDPRLLAAPAAALERCRELTLEMADLARDNLRRGIQALTEVHPDSARELRRQVDRAVEQALANEIASGTAAPGQHWTADCTADGCVTLQETDPVSAVL